MAHVGPGDLGAELVRWVLIPELVKHLGADLGIRLDAQRLHRVITHAQLTMN